MYDIDNIVIYIHLADFDGKWAKKQQLAMN